MTFGTFAIAGLIVLAAVLGLIFLAAIVAVSFGEGSRTYNVCIQIGGHLFAFAAVVVAILGIEGLVALVVLLLGGRVA